ncbi:hypothetical protein [Pseudomaricurvus sp. HS19]|uniref:hypothetical protein n=1 Tax=Pseudomaricurvus sp. HS19 TaxID=2692626 RepID=UPI00136D5633|nr:hypothetical protein [Pseudomaricurvus sp. HS19]MYM62300.1 hypothetical protein [Pseudomaricurvus sp. HS19]
MQYDKFVELHEQFPSGRYEVNSLQLRDLLTHSGCGGVAVRVLHLGTVLLDTAEMAERLRSDKHPRLDGIRITCLDGLIIIDEPSHGGK